RGGEPSRAHLDTTTISKIFGEHTRPRVWSATPASLTSGSGFSEGAEPRTRGRVRSPKSKRTRDVSDLANRVVVVSRCARRKVRSSKHPILATFEKASTRSQSRIITYSIDI